MSRRREAPRLRLRLRQPPRGHIWEIRDGALRISTGCGEHDSQEAHEALARYIAGKYSPPGALPAGKLLIDEVIAAYLSEYAQHSPSREFLLHTARPTLQWWSGKKLADVNGRNCRGYVAWRTRQMNGGRQISEQTARHDLKTLRSAINWYHREHGPLPSVPRVTLPEKAPQRKDYWLTRDQVAARIRAARKSARTAHVARVLLIGVYTGTRPGAILDLKWLPSAIGGWFDLDECVLHRRGPNARRSKKRQPPARIHSRLVPHLQRWRAQDLARGITAVIHYQGLPVKKLRRSWKTVAGLTSWNDAPHIVRHTAATWQMQAGTNLYEAAGYLGMSPETLWQIYGHHHPDFQSEAAKAIGKRRRKRDQSGPQSGPECSRGNLKLLN